MAENNTGVKDNLLLSSQAELLSSSQKSHAFWGGRTPRWLCQAFMATKSCTKTKGGIYRLNQGDELCLDTPTPPLPPGASPEILPMNDMRNSFTHKEGDIVNTSFSKYKVREIRLEILQTVLKVHTRIPELYSDTHNQLEQQMALAAEYLYETKENMLFNHHDFGLMNQCSPVRKSDKEQPITPDVLDSLVQAVWKTPHFFLMHPVALQAFHKETNRLGISLETCEMLGGTFSMWRGFPILPSNKLHLTYRPGREKDNIHLHLIDRPEGACTTNVMLLRMGAEKQGVISLYAEGTEGSQRFPFIKIDFMGIDDTSVASYLMTMYVGLAVPTPTAVAIAKVIV